jgi:hypothetical protein
MFSGNYKASYIAYTFQFLITANQITLWKENPNIFVIFPEFNGTLIIPTRKNGGKLPEGKTRRLSHYSSNLSSANHPIACST